MATLRHRCSHRTDSHADKSSGSSICIRYVHPYRPQHPSSYRRSNRMVREHTQQKRKAQRSTLQQRHTHRIGLHRRWRSHGRCKRNPQIRQRQPHSHDRIGRTFLLNISCRTYRPDNVHSPHHIHDMGFKTR